MNTGEAAQILAVAAVYDNRKPSAAAAQAWAADLAEVSAAEAAAAVREHYRANPGVWVMPGHVLAVVSRRRREGARGSWVDELRAIRRVDPDDPQAVLEALRQVHTTGSPQVEGRRALPPGRFAAGPSQGERNARGAAAARAALAEAQQRRDAEQATDRDEAA